MIWTGNVSVMRYAAILFVIAVEAMSIWRCITSFLYVQEVTGRQRILFRYVPVAIKLSKLRNAKYMTSFQTGTLSSYL